MLRSWASRPIVFPLGGVRSLAGPRPASLPLFLLARSPSSSVRRPSCLQAGPPSWHNRYRGAALRQHMDQYHPGKHAYSNPAAIDRTSVYRLEVEVDEGIKETAQITASLLGMPTAFFPKSPWARASRPRAVPPVGKAQKHMMEVSSGKKADTLALAAIGEVCARQAFRNLGLARFLRTLSILLFAGWAVCLRAGNSFRCPK